MKKTETPNPCKVLNLYISSGGTEATYDDVVNAQKEFNKHQLIQKYGKIIGNIIYYFKEINKFLDNNGI